MEDDAPAPPPSGPQLYDRAGRLVGELAQYGLNIEQIAMELALLMLTPEAIERAYEEAHAWNLMYDRAVMDVRNARPGWELDAAIAQYKDVRHMVGKGYERRRTK